MTVTDLRLNQLANDPMMCNITLEVQECLRELIALRAALADIQEIADQESSNPCSLLERIILRSIDALAWTGS